VAHHDGVAALGHYRHFVAPVDRREAEAEEAKAEVFAVKDGKESLCALMQQTIMVMHGKTEK